MVPYETTVNREIEVPVYREVDVYEDVEIEVPVEKLVEIEQVHETFVPVDIVTENVVENRLHSEIEKVVELTETIDRPVFNKQVRDIYHEKVIETKSEVPIEKYVEVPVVTEVI